MTRPNDYWFPAKRYGWGWGPPVKWQGWAVLIGSIAILVGGALRLMPTHPIAFLAFAVVIASLLTVICYITGEPPQWRWGK
jgi:uncharacterized membrane protein AbrB (regulator of aidB expression)